MKGDSFAHGSQNNGGGCGPLALANDGQPLNLPDSHWISR